MKNFERFNLYTLSEICCYIKGNNIETEKNLTSYRPGVLVTVRKAAFTLAEMMVVLLIMSIIMAAMAPVMTTKSKSDRSTPWKWSTNTSANAYFGTSETQTALIGQRDVADGDPASKLIINAPGTSNHILFKNGNTVLGRLQLTNDGIYFGHDDPESNPASRISIGIGAVSDNNGVSVGRISEARGNGSTALGTFSKAYRLHNTAIGYSSEAGSKSGEGASANYTGAYATAVGDSAKARANYSAGFGYNADAYSQRAIALGAESGAYYTNNIAVGYKAKSGSYIALVSGGTPAVSGENAIAIGTSTQSKSDNSISLGNTAKAYTSNSTAIGASSQAGNYMPGEGYSGPNAIAIGNSAKALGESSISLGYEPQATSGYSTAIGYHAKAYSGYNVAIGTTAQAGSKTTGSDGKDTYSGLYAIAIGSRTNASATSSIAIGYGNKINNGVGSIAIGNGIKLNLSDNFPNTVIGYRAMGSSSSSTYSGRYHNTVVGYEALKNLTTGWENTAVGHQAGTANTTGLGNSFFGRRAGYANTTGSSNIFIGNNTGGSNVSGNYNTYIGIGAGAWNVAGSNNIAIGTSACAFVKGSNKICIGDISGPSDGTTWAKADDTTERIFIGGRSKFNNGTAVLEVHNDEGKTTEEFSKTAVVINGNLVVKGLIMTNYSTNDGDDWTGANWNDRVGVLSADGNHEVKKGAVNDNSNTFKYYNGTGAFNYISDRRLKYVGKESSDGLDKIRQLKIFNYTFKKDEKKTPHVGVMAQDLQKVFPNAVTKGEDGFLRIRMEDMFYAVINAIKELDAKVTTLIEQVRKENNALRDENKRLRKDIDNLNKRLDMLEKKLK